MTKQWWRWKSCFDHLNQEFSVCWSSCTNSYIFMSREMLFRDQNMIKIEIMFWQAESRVFGMLIFCTKLSILNSMKMQFRDKTMINILINLDLFILASGFRLLASSLRLSASGFQPTASGFRLPVSRFRLPASSFWLLASGLRLPASGFRLPVRLPPSGFWQRKWGTLYFFLGDD